MSQAPSAAGNEQGQSSLFGEGELPAAPSVAPQPEAGAGEPRRLRAQRDQAELRPYDLDALLAADHPVRSVWAFVQALDLAPLYAAIKPAPGIAPAQPGWPATFLPRFAEQERHMRPLMRSSHGPGSTGRCAGTVVVDISELGADAVG